MVHEGPRGSIRGAFMCEDRMPTAREGRGAVAGGGAWGIYGVGERGTKSGPPRRSDSRTCIFVKNGRFSVFTQSIGVYSRNDRVAADKDEANDFRAGRDARWSRAFDSPLFLIELGEPWAGASAHLHAKTGTLAFERPVTFAIRWKNSSGSLTL